ncbi:Sugar (pentulose or hexulose) kinase [Sphingomonas laterariae]|uniref:Sugar (Pentulose or hexulose) kinase n=1 Tax=Edaphosphingomonas laterariae TaxID=861865 RepID=A0A239HYW7_9SPHN|nr:carbohydrate kinase [Sphingomonas laterariae]SNS86676.1 Sugar (pentulose or hexulose) kinase [Sphingomonas laterariae]
MTGLTIVLDIGKTLAKLTLWTADGQLVARRSRPNTRADAGDYAALDCAGIEGWLAETLREFANMGRIDAIIPVGHGAAAAIVRDGDLACPVFDYETPIAPMLQRAYARDRDDFGVTGSPLLPDGLNLGAQLHALEQFHPGLFAGDAAILLWPQYWAWRLSGVMASEATSLGCHSDLWEPVNGRPSTMARRRGWADRLPPVRHAGDALGTLNREWSERTGLPENVRVHCGLHDSNAALLAARGFPEIADHDATILSTGTWFVAMRSPSPAMAADLPPLPEARDCLVNVDVAGRPVPSARFMGGREIETLTGIDTRRIDIVPDQPLLVAAVPKVLANGAMVLPTFAAGFGPFAEARGRWIAMPADAAERRAAVCLYAALVASTSLDLIGSRGAILIEGRFAEAEVFVRALASLRPQDAIYTANAHNDVSFGALRLIHPTLQPASTLARVAPLDDDLRAYRDSWQREIARAGGSL